ncbi:MAG: acyl-CoA thioesterase [Magnetovibrionaceae bacterium]
MTEKSQPNSRADYKHFAAITTRWMDNDVYGHINNVHYYSYFDTVVNTHLIKQGVLDIQNSPVIGLVIETKCNYFRPMTYPNTVEGGLRVTKIGNSSIRYEVGLFVEGEEEIAAQGHFVHVYVDRASGRPTALPAALKALAESLFVAPE